MTNEKVHLIGNAKMIYENLQFPQIIIFNPITENFLQNKTNVKC